ncbi:DEAD/DEAH box helicase family protein [Chloroflexota bacterium]
MTTATRQTEYIKLEKRLILLAWLNDLFGYRSNQELLFDMREADEGFDSYGRSFIYHRLVGRGDKLNIPLGDLDRYDENIRHHLATINQRRPEPIILRYFQYLALLYAEVFLDWRLNHPGRMLKSLNDFVRDRNSRKPIGEIPDSEFSDTDLNKLAFWMATGSGKTLIMHINYLQFLLYNRSPLDNILLITPNEGLTEQHMDEMTASSVPCERFTLGESGLGLIDPDTVRVIEITKLVQEKRGGGVSVPVEAFEGNNLIFVDEGHKGSGGEVWRKFRDALGQTGFTFEYSATFGQALSASHRNELTDEYGKAIAFDYSYRYFHSDGYGKDFHILNLQEETTQEKTEFLLLGNLLSFYEQQRCFKEKADTLRPYNLDKPLWVFVGSSVNAVYTEARQKRSDVLTVTRFLHHFLENRNGWVIEAIRKIIDGRTGLIDAHGEDVFAGRFEYLRGSRHDAEAVFYDILSSVFHTSAAAQLHMADIRGMTGELGLRAGNSEDYFGLIYIGDTSTFKKLVEADDTGINVEDDVISDSLFEGINDPASKINVLIGAKKFMEGWNSWRVSNMGLLNIGRTEGSEIIQLFGRGVRLRGIDFSLKRSSAIDGEHPEHIRLLETLNIFAVRANYMAQFREYLEREGIETEGHIELPLEIKPNEEFLGKGLFVPSLPEDKDFATEYNVFVVPDTAAKVNLDLSLKVQSMRSLSGQLATTAMKAGQEQIIPSESLDLIDWEAVYIKLLEFKEEKGFANLIIQADMPRKLLEREDPKIYSLVSDDNVVRPRSFAEIDLLQETTISILRKYLEKYYRVCKERWDSKNRVYALLDENDDNFQDYSIRIARSETDLIAAVKTLIDEGNRIYKDETRELPNIHFDRHLYQPLLIERGDRLISKPPGLNQEEQRFVNDLRELVRQETSKSLANKEIFLLRNLSRGKGVGFFENEGFYPDFILWIKEGSQQRVVFVEPHGMLHEKAYELSDKTTLHERLCELSKSWAKKTDLRNVSLDSYIISVTPYEKLRLYYGDGTWSRGDFISKHILFPEPPEVVDYLKPLFEAS